MSLPDPAPPDARAHPRWPAFAWAPAATASVTLAAWPLAHVLDAPNIVMLYLLATLLVAMRFGRAPAALATVFNVAAFDFFFVPPTLSFAVRDLQYLVTFLVMLLVGLVTGELTARLRQQAQVAAQAAGRAQSLFTLAGELSGALQATQVGALGAAAVRTQFGGEAFVLATDGAHRVHAPQPSPQGFDLRVAQALVLEEHAAGASPLVTHDDWHYLPLAAPARVRGVLALRCGEPGRPLAPEERQHLQTLARQIAIALERVHYVEVAQQAMVDVESERLRSGLLAAISHDVRTPLTALIGLAESLQATKPPLAPVQAEVAAALVQQARALARLVHNLLDMARLQAGAVRLRLQWESLQEVVGSALRQAAPVLAGVSVRVDVPAELPLVEVDALLLERVLVNLLENAARYGAPPIEVRAWDQPQALCFAVRDHGRGLPAALRGREHLLFEKFTRGVEESAIPGVGLGLAICKAAVEAHGGRIHAADAAGGGAEFHVRLPRRAAPMLPT